MKSVGITVAIALGITLTPPESALAQATNNTSNSTSSSHLDLSSNECLKTLSDQDIVIASIAFKDGVTGYGQLKELVSRKPWGKVPTDTQQDIESQVNTRSPFLIIRLTKAQTLTLDSHRDIIRWVLVQSPTKSCK